MDTDTNIPEEKGGNVALSPNNSGTSEPGLQTNATTTKDEAQILTSAPQTTSSNDNATSCGDKEGVGGGTTLLVNVHNFNQNLKTSQEPPASFGLHMSNTPKFPTTSKLDKDGSVMGINDSTASQMSSNCKNPPTTVPAISSSIIYNKCSLPQTPDHDDSNKQVGNLGEKSLDKDKSSIVEKVKSYSSNLSENPPDTKTVSGLSEKANPIIGSYEIDRTESSSETRDKLLNETKNTASVNAGESVLVKPLMSVSKYLPSQSHRCTKSENHQPMSLNVETKGDLSVRTSIDNSTTNLASSSEPFRNTAYDIKTTKSTSHDLAVLEEAIAAKKATAMLSTQKQSVPPKNTPSLLAGSGSLLKTGTGNNNTGSKLVDSLLKHAEARAAKEASVAAAAAATKKSSPKEDAPESLQSLSSSTGMRIDKEDINSYNKTTADNAKGNTNISHQINTAPDENVNKLSSNTAKLEMTSTNKSSSAASTTTVIKQSSAAGEDLIVNLGSSMSSTYSLNKSTDKSSSLQSAASAPQTLTTPSSHPVGEKELPLSLQMHSKVDNKTQPSSTLTESSILTAECIGPKNLSYLEKAATCGNMKDDCKREKHSASITASTKFPLSPPPSSKSTSQEEMFDTPSSKDGSVPVVVDKDKRGDYTQTISSPTKSCNVELLNREESSNKKENTPTSLKRELSLPPAGSKDPESPGRKRLKTESTDSVTNLSSSPSKVIANLQLTTKLSETSKKQESPETKPQLSGSSSSSVKSSSCKNTTGGIEDASVKHLFKPSNERHRDSVEEAMGKLFGGSGGTPTKCSRGEGVTISPVRSKDLAALITHSSSNVTSNSLDVHSSASRLKLLPSSSSESEKSSSSPTITSASIPKALESKIPSSSSASTGSSIGSVTITKLSTGSSLNVKSKDLKNLISGSNNGTKSGAGTQGTMESGSVGLMQHSSKNKLTVSKASGMHHLPFDNNGFSLKNAKVDLVPISSLEGSVSNQESGFKSTMLAMKSLEKHGRGEGDKQTSKVNHAKHQLQNMVFPHLHGSSSSEKLSVGSQNSISINDREQESSRKANVLSQSSDTPSSSISSQCSTGSARIGTSDAASLANSSENTTSTSKSTSSSISSERTTPTSGASIHLSSTSSTASKKSSNLMTACSGNSKNSIPSNKLPSRNSSNDQSSKSIKCKLIRDSKDELHIEGRPKLSIRKVATPDSGGIITGSSQHNRNPSGSSISIVPERKSSGMGGGKPMAKLKLSESSVEGLKPDRNSFSNSKNSGIGSSAGMPFGKPTHQHKKQHTEDTPMSSVTSVASNKTPSSLSVVSGSTSSSIGRSSIGPSNFSFNKEPINFPSHHTHGGKPITMKSGLSSNSKSASSSMGSPVGTGSTNKTLPTSNSTKTSSDVSKSDPSGSKLKIKLNITSSSSGLEGKNTSSGSGSNISGKTNSDLAKLERTCSPSYSSVDAKNQLNKSKVSVSDCDNIEQTKKSSSTGPSTVTEISGDHEAPSGFPSFDFAGKPTYSPSRVEPITSMGATLQSMTSNPNVTTVQPTKESPRDASNKDSPASQADSGVFSIASSNSPSKDRDGGSMGSSGSSGTASTSPDSPSRIDRMPTSFVDQQFSNTDGNVGIGGGVNPASREPPTSWKPTTTQGDALPGKQEVQQNPSSSIPFMKSSSMSEISDAAKTSTPNENTAFSRAVSSSEPPSSSPLVTSKCSNVTTSSSQQSLEEASKNNSQSGIRGNHNQSTYQQQRQQAVHQQQMMQQNYTNGPSPSVARTSSGAEQPGFHPMYRPGAGTFPNAGGRPPYGPGVPYNQRNADFFGYNSTASSPSVMDRGTEPPAKRKRGRPRKAGMGGMQGDSTKPPKRSYVRKKKLEHSQLDMDGAPDEGVGNVRQEHGQSAQRVPVAGLPQQQRRAQGGSTFGSSSGGEGRGTNIYNFDDEEFQDDSFGLRGNQPGPLRVGQRKTPTSASQSSGSSHKFGGPAGCSGFGSQDSSDEDLSSNKAVGNSGSSTETSSHMGSQPGMKTSTVMNQQASNNPTFSGMPVGNRGNASLIGAMRQQYSGSNIGLRQPGPVMSGNRGGTGTSNMMQHGVRGGMGGPQMNQMHQQRMHAMQAQQQRMQMQSQQQQQHMQQHQQMQQQQGGQQQQGEENEETAYSSEIVTKGSGIKLKIKLKKTAEEEAAAKKSRKRKQDDESGNANTHSPNATSAMAKANVSSSDKFTPTSSVNGPSGNICQGSMSSGSATSTTSPTNMNQPSSTMSAVGPNRAAMQHQGGISQSQFPGATQQQVQPNQQQYQYKMTQHQQCDQNRQSTSAQSSTNLQNQQMGYQSQMGNKQGMASHQSGNLQQQSSIRPQQQQMLQQQMTGNNQQMQGSTPNLHNTNQQALQGRQAQHNQQMSQHLQQNTNQQQVNKNNQQHPNPHLQRNQGMQQNVNQQLHQQGHGMGMQGATSGSAMAQHNQIQQRAPFMNMNNTNTNNAVSGMMGSMNSPMRSPLGTNATQSSTVTSPSVTQGSGNSNQGGQGNSSNSVMINPFSQQQMLQQRQQQMMAANSGNMQSNNSGMSNIPVGAQGNAGMGMGQANVQGNVVPSSSAPNANANLSSGNQGNSNVNMVPGMSPNNSGMNIRPGLQGHSYGMPGNMGMNMGPSNQGNNSNMSMGAGGNGGQGMAGNVGMAGMPGGMGMNSTFAGSPNQFGNGGGPAGTRMPIPYQMQQHQAGFYGGAPNQAGHGNFGPQGPGPSGHNPMANNFMQMQQRQRMMAMQGMQNQFTGPNGANGMQGQFSGMANHGSETSGMVQFGNARFNGPTGPNHPNQFGGGPGGAMTNNPMGGSIVPRPPGPAGTFGSQQQSQMGGFNAQQQRMMGPGQRMSSESQQLPPHFRTGPGVLGSNSMNNPGMPGNPPGMIGRPRISPSAMQRPMPGVGMGPMPGVGMPRISPQHGNASSMSGMGAMQQSPQQHNPQLTPRHPTPLVSPQSMQSMHSESVQSPVNTNPLTPGGNGGPATPNQPPNSLTPQHYSNIASPSMGHMQHNPRTPQSHHMMTSPHPSMTSPHPSMTSPHPSMGPSPSPRGPGGESTHLYTGPYSAIVPSPQQQYQYSNNDDGQQSQQQPMMSPAHMGMQMKSPMMHGQLPPGASNLRKIRRQSKPKGEASDDFMGNSGAQFTQQQHQPQAGDVFGQPLNDLKSEVKDEKPQTPSTPQMTPFKEATLEPKYEMKFDIKEEIKQEESKELNEPKFEAKWNELPNKILNHVFAYCVVNESSNTFLVKAAKVCRQWWQVAIKKQMKMKKDEKDEDDEKIKTKSDHLDLWTHLDLSVSYLKEKHRNDRKLEWMLRKYPKVLELKLNGWKNAVNTSTLKIIAANKALVSLSLVGCFKLSNEDLKLIGDTLPALQRIDLSNVSASSCSSRSAVSSTALSDFISATGKRLTHFNISNNKMAGLPFVFKALSMQSSNLEELDISNITTTSRDTILINMEKFQKGCPKLRVLNANHTMLSLVETPVREQVHSTGFPLLRELYIAVDSRGYFDGLDDSQIERILKKSSDLRTLDVRGCQHVTESCLIRIPTWYIEKLVVAGSSAVSGSSDGLELMVKKWAKTLRELDVSGTSGDRTINNAFDALIDSAPDTVIKKLNICSTSASIKPLTRLLKNCPTIEYLNLQSCRGLPRGMKRLHANKEAVLQLKSDILDGKYNGSEDSD